MAKLSAFQITMQITDHLIIRPLLTICIPDLNLNDEANSCLPMLKELILRHSGDLKSKHLKSRLKSRLFDFLKVGFQMVGL